MRRAATATTLALTLGLVAAGPAAAAKKPPAADYAAQVTCQTMHKIEVNAEFGFGPTSPDVTSLIGTLDESKSRDAQKLSKMLFNAPTEAAQQVAIRRVGAWCANTLALRCSISVCEGGNQVTKIKAKRR